MRRVSVGTGSKVMNDKNSQYSFQTRSTEIGNQQNYAHETRLNYKPKIGVDLAKGRRGSKNRVAKIR